MKIALDQPCLGHGDLVSYLSGVVHAANKQRIESHLSACCWCFEIFIDLFNQYLEPHRQNEVRLGRDEFPNFAKPSCPSRTSPLATKIP